MTPFDENENSARQNSANEFKEELTSTARDASSTIKQQASQKLNENRDKAADQLEGLAHAAQSAASDLEEQNQQGLSHYITEIASNVSSLAHGLREKSIDELMQDAQNIARKNPAIFIGASIAIGLGIARFAKASSHRSHRDLASQRQGYEGSNYTTDKNQTSDTLSNPDKDFDNTREYSSANEFGRAPSAGNSLKQGGNGASTIGGSRYE